MPYRRDNMSVETNTQLLQSVKAKLASAPAPVSPDEWKSIIDRTIVSIDLSKFTKIYNYVFSGCQSLSIDEIPANIASVGADAFYKCLGITKLKIKCGEIGSLAFQECSNLKKVWISNDVAVITATANTKAPLYKCSTSLIVYTDASARQSGWGSKWNYGKGTLGTAYTTKYNITEAEFDAL